MLPHSPEEKDPAQKKQTKTQTKSTSSMRSIVKHRKDAESLGRPVRPLAHLSSTSMLSANLHPTARGRKSPGTPRTAGSHRPCGRAGGVASPPTDLRPGTLVWPQIDCKVDGCRPNMDSYFLAEQTKPRCTRRREKQLDSVRAPKGPTWTPSLPAPCCFNAGGDGPPVAWADRVGR